MTDRSVPRRLAEIDWSRWEATDIATLLFVFRDEEVLLIRKKRGLGAGKINGPGGRLEAGESRRQCAIREVVEEVGIEPLEPREHGELRFQFVDGYSIHVWVFRSESHRGKVTETAEAVPLWTPVEAIPYGEMWADDEYWLPHLLAGRRFRGEFVFDGDRMLDRRVEVLED